MGKSIAFFRKLFLAGMSVCCLFFSTNISANTDVIKAEYPVLITSFGQAPDGNTLKVLSGRIGAETTYETLASPERVKEFKTVIVSIGVSLKGFGAAGVNLDTETERASEIIKTIKQNEIKLIITHIGGEGRRDQMSNKLIENFAGTADELVVYKDGNADGIFSKIAADNNIPLIEMEKLTQLTDTLRQILK